MAERRDWDDDYCRRCGHYVEPGTTSVCSDCRRTQLDRMNADVERLYREGRDLEARNLEERANALARQTFRSAA